MKPNKAEIVAGLRRDLIAWEGFRPPQPGATGTVGLGSLESGFPNGVFPTGAIHEFMSSTPEESSACGALITGILASLLKVGGACVWVSYTRRVYPPALKLFGLDPERVIFVDVPKPKEVLWVTEEALKCEGVAAVICETRDLSLMESRRLQLAVEQSHATGFVLRKDVKQVTSSVCTARWQVKPQRSRLRSGMPGVGFPRWTVELLKVKNGSTGRWILEWQNFAFREITETKRKEVLRRYA